MAKIEISIDTKNKSVAISVDGKKVPDVKEAFFSTEKSFLGFSVEVVSSVEENDLRTVTRLVADKTGELVEDPESVRKDIEEFFTRKYK